LIYLLRNSASKRQIEEMLQTLETYIKLAVDIERGILAGGGALHADGEAVLIDDGSRQEDIWADCPLHLGGCMKNQTLIRERYLRDPLPIRLGGLAANLARVRSFADHPRHGATIESLIDESKFFVEWAAPDADVETQAALVALQVQLALWQLNWPTIWPDPARRAVVAKQAQEWSDKVLEMSGLLSGD
jgi:hypothetical protein